MSDDEYKPPVVTEAPESIFLCYGDIDQDYTHAELYRMGDISWCDTAVDDSDVAYIRADKYDAQAAEIERLRRLVEAHNKTTENKCEYYACFEFACINCPRAYLINLQEQSK